MTTARLLPMPDADVAAWRSAGVTDGVPLPEIDACGSGETLRVEVDGVVVGGALLEYVEDGGVHCFVRVLQSTVPPEADEAWAALLAALDEHARRRRVTSLVCAVAPELARAFDAAGFRATMMTVGKRLIGSPFAPELQRDHRVTLHPMSAAERHRFAAEALDVMRPGMERAGVADRSSSRLLPLAERLARIGADPAPGDELLMTASVGDVTVGRFWATLTEDADGALDAFGNLVELFPEHRGQGLTKSLLGAVRRHLHRLGVRDLSLRVLGYDTGAVRTFRTAGYGVIDVHLRKVLV